MADGRPETTIARRNLTWGAVAFAPEGRLLAVARAPGAVDLWDPDARAFLGYILIQDAHDPVGASEQFRAFLADHPQAQMVSLTSDVVAQAFAAVGQPVPPPSSPSGS